MPSPSTHGNRLRWNLTLERQRVDDVLVVVPRGRMSSATAPMLTEALSTAIGEGETRVIVDLARVDYISSAGLIGLHALSGRMAVSRGTLLLCGLTDPVRLVFELAGLMPDFTVVADRESALERLRLRKE